MELAEYNVPQFDYILDKGTSLSVISAHKGKEFTTQVVGLLISDMSKAYNVIRPLTGDQIADLAFEIVTDYYFMKLEDFCAFLHLCRKGKYGRVLDRLDPGLINEWFAAYMLQRDQHIEKKAYDYSFEAPAERKQEESGLSNASFAMSEVKHYIKQHKSATDKANPALKKNK